MFCEHVGIQTYTPGSLFILKKKKSYISFYLKRRDFFFCGRIFMTRLASHVIVFEVWPTGHMEDVFQLPY